MHTHVHRAYTVTPRDTPSPPQTTAGLVQLDLSTNRFARLPLALSAATALRRLSLARNATLQLALDDLPVLRQMSSLTKLELSASTAKTVPAALRKWLGSRLQVLAETDPPAA